MHSRDTVIKELPLQTSTYAVQGLVQDLGSGCASGISYDRVTFTVHTVDFIQLNGGPWTIGQCHDTDLRELLQPTINGVPLDSGMFYINNIPVGVSDIWLSQDLKADSCHRIKCEYTDAHGCLVTSDEVKVCVDSLPHAKLWTDPSGYACPGDLSQLHVETYPSGKVATITILETTYKQHTGMPNLASQQRTWEVTPTYSTPNDYYKLPDFDINLSWTDLNGKDSCKIFKVTDMYDIHGCRMDMTMSESEYNANYTDTIIRRWDWEVKAYTRTGEYLSIPGNEDSWTYGINPIEMTRGDSLEVKLVLTKGQPTWSAPGIGLYHIQGRDTTVTLYPTKDTTYCFTGQDDVCGADPFDENCVDVRFRDTAYFRGRLFLEGPYDVALNQMTSNIAAGLSLPAESSLSAFPSSFLSTGVKIIDRVSLELRTGPVREDVARMGAGSCVLAHDTAYVLSNGYLADYRTGDTIVGILNAVTNISGYRYLVVKHRNHLGVMTNVPHPFYGILNPPGGIRLIDFTKESTIWKHSAADNLENHMTKKTSVTGDVWMLSVGELNSNDLITVFDPNKIALDNIDESGVKGYELQHDVNFNGVIEWPGWNGNTDGSTADWSMVRNNRDKFTEIE
jgi:hypothetical protein